MIERYRDGAGHSNKEIGAVDSKSQYDEFLTRIAALTKIMSEMSQEFHNRGRANQEATKIKNACTKLSSQVL